MSDFDFKKAQRELIRRELRPVLYENGFVLSRPTTYIREREGLLQEFYFRIEVSKLRPWVSCRPVYDSRCIVDFGTDSICVNDCLNPYKGYGWCFFDDRYPEDASRRRKNYESQFLPRFEMLKNSIINAVLPELNRLHSLGEFMRLHEANGSFFQKPMKCYDTPGKYYDFISGVEASHGKERMNLIISEMQRWDLRCLPKIVREYLEGCMGHINSDEEADKMFCEYCNKIRTANKLGVK